MAQMFPCLIIFRTIITPVRCPYTIEKFPSSLIYNKDRPKVCIQAKMLMALK